MSLVKLAPLVIIIIGFAGQFDTLALLPLLGAMYLWLRTPDRPPTAHIWLLCVAALLVKHLIVFHVWMLLLVFLPRRRALLLFGAALLVWLGSFTPFVATGAEGILDHVLLYNGWFGMYGFGKLLPFRIAPALFYMIMIVLPLIITDKRSVQPVACLTMASVALIAFLHGIGPHYLLIPLVWGSIARGRWYWMYSAAALLVLMGVRDFLHLYRPPLWELAWLSALGWLGWCLLNWWDNEASQQVIQHITKHIPLADMWLHNRT